MSIPLMKGNRKLESFGFKLSYSGGAHISRTMMLKEVSQLLAVTSPTTTSEEYRKAVFYDNALGKATETTRAKTFRHLRELYGLSTNIPLFRIYRELMLSDPQSAPLLSLLVAWARDPLLRATTAAVLDAGTGDEVGRETIQQRLTEFFPGQYSSLNIAKIARNAASSWTQSGHLVGRLKKVRCRVQARPAAAALALLLGYVSNVRGEQLFTSSWCQLLDLTGTQARSLAVQAHREELLTMRAIGTVVEINFPRFSRLLEEFA